MNRYRGCFKEKNYLHERTIDVRSLLSSAFCDDPYVNHDTMITKQPRFQDTRLNIQQLDYVFMV